MCDRQTDRHAAVQAMTRIIIALYTGCQHMRYYGICHAFTECFRYSLPAGTTRKLPDNLRVMYKQSSGVCVLTAEIVTDCLHENEGDDQPGESLEFLILLMEHASRKQCCLEDTCVSYVF